VDPVSIIALVVLLSGIGAGGLAVRKSSQRKEMQAAVVAPIACGEELVLSLFDVFWDLGANEFTLEMMAHRGLLLDQSEDLSTLLSDLPVRISEHGGYKQFVDDLLVSIQEYRESNRPTQNQRLLASPARKLLPLPKSPEAMGPDDSLDRQVARTGNHQGSLVHEPRGEEVVDIDQVLETDALDLIGSLFAGKGTKKVKQWFGLRAARSLREQLDAALVSLYETYFSVLQTPPNALDHLYHEAKRWDAEVVRVGLLAKRRSWRQESWASCADALIAQAKTLCASLAASGRTETAATVLRINKLAKDDDKAMAGYLVYLNRYALFAGRLASCDTEVRGVETATHRLRQELRECRAKGLV
jgi:hypothetical protein